MNELMEFFIEPFQYPFMQRAIIAAVIIGIACAILSCYMVLKGWSLMGDAISHAVLPGVVLAYVTAIPLTIGAFLSGYLYKHTGKLWAAVLGEFVGTSLLGGLVSYPVASLFMGSTKGAFFYVSLFAVSCGAGCVIAFVVLKGIHLFQTGLVKNK